jgi:hypothetical protein
MSSFLFAVVEYLVARAENDAVAQLLLVLHVEDVLEGEVQECVVVLPHLYGLLNSLLYRHSGFHLL